MTWQCLIIFGFHIHSEYKSLDYGLDEVKTPTQPRLTNMLKKDLVSFLVVQCLFISELFLSLKCLFCFI